MCTSRFTVTVAILAQGTNWAVAVTQASFGKQGMSAVSHDEQDEDGRGRMTTTKILPGEEDFQSMKTSLTRHLIGLGLGILELK